MWNGNNLLLLNGNPDKLRFGKDLQKFSTNLFLDFVFWGSAFQLSELQPIEYSRFKIMIPLSLSLIYQPRQYCLWKELKIKFLDSFCISLLDLISNVCDRMAGQAEAAVFSIVP